MMSDIKGIEISDILGISQPLTKLVETVSNAVGKLYEPVYIRQIAKAKADEIQSISKALNENISLPVNYSGSSVAINTENFEALAKRTGNRLVYQEMRKQQNIETIVNLAGDELKKEQSVTDEPVDHDWTTRFFNSVEDVSNEDMQKIWGRILAGEIKHPYSFSMRTLEILKNLSPKEALLFQKLSNYCFWCSKDCMFSGRHELLDKFGINFADILKLEECGLVKYPSLLYFANQPGEALMINNQSMVGILRPKNESVKVTFSIYALTSTGSEIFKIIEKSPDDSYFMSCLNH